jgi:beta-phosphoglucomutase-like phosphatase (HAD superfamily)
VEGCGYTTSARLARHAGLKEGEEDDDGSEFTTVGQRLGQEFDDYYIALVSIKTTPLFDGIGALIENLPMNIKLAALTNAAGRYAHAVLQVNSVPATAKTTTGEEKNSYSLYQRFQAIYGADEVPKPKPFGDGLVQVCETLNVLPSDCVYVGDAPSDGMAAKAAGMKAIGVIWGAHTEESLRSSQVFDCICQTVDDLRRIIPQR